MPLEVFDAQIQAIQCGVQARDGEVTGIWYRPSPALARLWDPQAGGAVLG
jgi:hypothetical protein